MTRTSRGLLLAMGLLVLVARCWAQESLPPPAPTSSAAPAAGPVFLPPPPPPGAVAPVYPAPADPAWEWVPPPGWFANFELDLVGPHVKNRLVAPVQVDGLPFLSSVHLPSAELDWTAMPRFELGYRMKDDLGELAAAFRFLYTEGEQTVPGYDFFGPGWLTSRLNLNVLDLDYRTGAFDLGPRGTYASLWACQWAVGLRLANVFFDSRAQGRFLEQRTSNLFVGLGPHAALQMERRFGDTGLSLYGKLDAAVPIGRVSQAFEEVVHFNGDGGALGGATRQSGTQATPTLTFQVGLSWQPPRYDFSRFALGYYYEQWWYVGQLEASRGDLTLQGLFFRGGIEF